MRKSSELLNSPATPPDRDVGDSPNDRAAKNRLCAGETAYMFARADSALRTCPEVVMCALAAVFSSASLARVAALATALAAVAACSRSDERPKVPLGEITAQPQASPAPESLSDAARAALDSGNVAFRAGRYQAALASYRHASSAAPASAAPFFGIYMAAQKLGNRALADSANAEIAHRTATTTPMLGDSSMKALHTAVPAKP